MDIDPGTRAALVTNAGCAYPLHYGAADGLAPEELIDHILAEVGQFVGAAPRSDDMTCAVVCVDN